MTLHVQMLYEVAKHAKAIVLKNRKEAKVFFLLH